MSWHMRFFIFILLLCNKLFAVELVNEQFTSNIFGWSYSNSNNVYQVSYYGNGYMFIDAGDNAYRTYDFGQSFANQPLDIALRWCATDEWENYQDYLRIRINDTNDYYDFRGGGCQTISLSDSASINGTLKIDFSPIVTRSNEDAFIDWITVNGEPGIPNLNIEDFTDTEGDNPSKTFSIPVTLIPTSSTPISVDYSTSDGTAIATDDYNTKSGTLSFAPNEHTKYIDVTVIGDNDDNESDENFYITLSNAQSNGSVLIDDNQALITIEEDDSPEANENYREFSLRKQLYLKGNMKTIGNSVLVPPTNQYNGICDTYTDGNFIENANSSNANYYLCGYKKDSATSNSTTAELDIPSHAKIIWAGLYWQALVSNSVFSSNNYNLNMPIKIKKESGNYFDISFDSLDYLDNSGKDGYTSYSAFKDITNLFINNQWKDGNYTVANIPVHEGKVSTLGTYGAWTMVVIYEDLITAGAKFRSFSVFDGWKVVKDDPGYRDVSIDVSGFYTPNRNDLNAEISVFAAEGDKHIDNDYLKTTNYNTNQTVNLTPDGINNQTFNSSISGNYNKTPSLINNNGIDIQSFSIGNYLTPKQTDMTFHFTSNQDTYWPSMLVFNTELYEPKICYDFSYRQNGVELDISSDLGSKPLLDTFLSDSPIEVGIYFRNKEADLAIENLSFSTNMDSNLTNNIFYKEDSTFISSINGSVLEGPLFEINSNNCDYSSSLSSPKVCNNDGNIRVGLGKNATGFSQHSAGELGSEEYQFFQFQLDNSLSGRQNIDLNMSIDYYIRPDGGTPIPRTNRFLGQEIEICSENTLYSPIWGIFNVADRGSNYYNLKTQIAKKPFDVDLQYFEKDPNTDEYTVDTPTKDINTSVIIEIFDVEPFHDIQAACANPTAHTSEPIYLNVNLVEDGDNHIQIPTQNADFYNFAIQNAAFRVWHFNDANGALLENFSIDNNGTSINGLYNSTVHKDCIVKCNNAENSETCYECIQAKYSTPVCSRDNFAIRPEAFDIRLHDINQTTMDITTKLDLTKELNYAPDSATAPTTKINLAAGYTLMYDINATNHQNLKSTPWYVRTLDVNSSWDPSISGLTCNDTSNHTTEVGFNLNGAVLNRQYFHNNVGEYLISLSDTNWARVDRDKTHHISGYFDMSTDSDCIPGSSTSSGSTLGCEIRSNHTNHDTGDIYRNIEIAFKPYRFNIDSAGNPIVFSRRADNNTTLNNTFIYTSNVDDNNSMNMALNIIGSIIPEGFNSSTLSNYTGGCYADDLDLTLNRVMPATFDEAYQARFMDRNSTGAIITDTTQDVNATNQLFTVADGNFTLDNNGVLPLEMHLNFAREANQPRQPLRVQLDRFNVNCTTAADCQFNADLMNNQEANATRNLNGDILTHYYGRVHAPDQRFEVNPGDASIYYEVFCEDCTQAQRNTFLIGDTESTDSINWYQNVLHDDTADGQVTDANITSVGGSVNVDAAGSTPIQDGMRLTPLQSDKVPNKERMQMRPDPWLLYNRFNANPATNDFNVEFYAPGGNWAGDGDLGHTVDENVSTIQNRRLDW